MRVISGNAGGMKLQSPDGIRIRPTADRVKESVFNKIAFDLPGTHFLDLFGGTGAIGIEALSRGAELAVIADSSIDSCDIITRNLIHTKLADKARVLREDYITVIKNLAAESKRFDFIYLDPPYYAGMAENAAKKIIEFGLLANEGFVIAETALDEKIEFVDYHIYNEKKYGATKIYILCINGNE